MDPTFPFEALMLKKTKHFHISNSSFNKVLKMQNSDLSWNIFTLTGLFFAK